MTATIILCILGAACITGAVLVMRYAFTFAKPKQPELPPLPGSEGGGFYSMTVEGLETELDARKLKAVLNKVPHIHSEVNAETGEVHIRYDGFPALDLLDTLRERAESAGYTVKSLE